jgi:hypothetical protein
VRGTKERSGVLRPIQLEGLPSLVQKLALADAPEKPQELAAKGLLPGVKPADLLALLTVLSGLAERPSVASTATATLANLPEQLLTTALQGDLQPAALDAVARANSANVHVLSRLLTHAAMPHETVVELARGGTEAVCELVATNESRLLAYPVIIEALYLNRRTRMSTADRVVDLAARNGVQLSGIPAFREVEVALQGELISEPSAEPTPDDELFRETEEVAQALANAEDDDTHVETEEGKEELKDKYMPLLKKIGLMTPSQKIRRALLGTREERMLLIRDSNKLVCSAVVRSPMIQEGEITAIAKNRNVPEEVLRIIATTAEWMRSYQIKRNLVENPKCPQMIAMKLVQHMRESDLRALAKSKNIMGPVKDAARRQLEKRK